MGKKELIKSKKLNSKAKRKRKRSSSSSSSRNSLSSSSSTESFSSIDEELKKKLKKKLKKLKEKEKQKKRKKKALKKLIKTNTKDLAPTIEGIVGPSPSLVSNTSLENSKILAPMTKEEWESQQNTLKRVYDEATKRTRLVKGTGEIVEECVSRERHLAINKQATKGDGEYFQKKLLQQIK